MTFFLVCEWLGTAAFAVSGAMVAIDKGMDLFGVIFLAMVMALGGGMIRDVLLKEIPFVLNKRIYAVAAIAGALTYWVIEVVFLNPVLAYALGWLVVVTLRMLATIYKWNLPKAI